MDVPIKEVEMILRECYPTGHLDELAVEKLDRHISSAELRAMFDEVAGSPLIHADWEEATLRSHTIYIGMRDAPSWVDFNRRTSDRKRLRYLGATERSLIYWMLSVSRLGRFWIGNWNEFVIRSGRIVPVVVTEPSTWEWHHVRLGVRGILEGHGFREVTAHDADHPIRWMRGSTIGRPGATDDAAPTLFESLFMDY